MTRVGVMQLRIVLPGNLAFIHSNEMDIMDRVCVYSITGQVPKDLIVIIDSSSVKE